MVEVFRGVKIRDVALAGALTALGVVLMRFDIHVSDAQVAKAVSGGSMVHPMSSHSAWMLPVFLAATVPVLWWRRGVLAVTGIAVAVMALHDVLFGWVTRCSAGLPLACVLAFLGALSYERATAFVVGGLALVLSALVVVVDSTTGPGALLLAVPVIAVVFAVGRATRHRATLGRELRQRDEELRRLRDERAALKVDEDRTQLSRRLDGLLRERLEQLTTAAESAEGLPPGQARALLESIEAVSRQTLDDMREIVGLLRGDEVTLAPTPTVAHLDALLVRNRANGSYLHVTGHPRSLPPTVELSAYRIVEHLLTALADRPNAPVDVTVRFADEALEIRVSGPVGKGPDVRAAVARARERAKLLGGSVEVKVARGRAGAVASLPVVG
jgi:signal transduction histidine kinase